MKKSEIYKKILLNYFIALLVLVFVIFIAPHLIRFFLPFVIGWIISLICNPLVHFLEKRLKIVRKHGSAIIIIAVLAAVVGLIYLVCTILFRQIAGLFRDFPELSQRISIQLSEFGEKLNGFADILPGNLHKFWVQISQNTGEYLSKFISGIEFPSIGDAGNFAKNIVEVLFYAIITIISAYFFVSYKDKLSKGLREHAPVSLMEKLDMIGNNFKTAVGGYFAAQFKIMIIIVILLFIGFEILDVDYAILLAILVAFIDLLPVFGTGTVIGPWAVIEFINKDYFSAICLIIIYVVCQLVKQLLQPKMVGDSVGMNPLLTLFFMFAGYQIGGLFGLIIGIPIGMVIVNFYKAGVFDDLIKGAKFIAKDISEYRKY